MSDQPIQSAKSGWLAKPTYGYIGPAPAKPTLQEVLVEWFDSISFWKDSTRLLPALYAGYHVATFFVFAYFLVRYFSVSAFASVIGIAVVIGTVYNTVWYHRYCSHQAFQFRSVWFARLFLWTNPVSFREESYVIPHRVHHAKSDEPGDPYGPHLGWLGSYLATETQQKMNRDVSLRDFERLVKSLEHIGLVKNSYEAYLRTGSVENIWVYAARVVLANVFWAAVGFAAAGWPGVLAWISGVFLLTCVLRDFNFRGHAGLVGTDRHGAPVNQLIYGIIAGEWHENHHEHPRLARSGMVWWQIDIPFVIIRLMKVCGLVTRYNYVDAEATEDASEPAEAGV